MVVADNGSDHRVRTEILQAEKTTRKPDFVCIALLSRNRCCGSSILSLKPSACEYRSAVITTKISAVLASRVVRAHRALPSLSHAHNHCFGQDLYEVRGFRWKVRSCVSSNNCQPTFASSLSIAHGRRGQYRCIPRRE